MRGPRGRWREDLPPGLAAGYHTRTTRDDQTAQRDRASDRSYEHGRQTRQELAQRCLGRRDARSAVRRRPQPQDDPEEAAAFLRLHSRCFA